MKIRFADENELEKWQKVAKDVAEIFGNPLMAEDPEYITYAQRKIYQKEALIAVDENNEVFYGFIGFSKHFNRITWLGVFEKDRNKGIGSQLLEKAMWELDQTKEITVETFRENYRLGKPARHVYKKIGFKEVEGHLFDSFGNERCRLSRLHIKDD